MNYPRNNTCDHEIKELPLCGDSGARCSVTYPVFPCSGRLSRFCAARALHRVRAFEAACAVRAEILSVSGFDARLESSVHVMYEKKGIVSLYRDTYESVPPHAPRLYRESMTWMNDRPLGLDELFGDTRGALDVINDNITREIWAGQTRCPGSFYFRVPKARWGWFLTERGLTAWFPVGAVAPENAGIPTFLTTWSELLPFIALSL